MKSEISKQSSQVNAVEKKIKRIHVKFGHAAKEKLEKMFKNTSAEKTIGQKQSRKQILETVDKCKP